MFTKIKAFLKRLSPELKRTLIYGLFLTVFLGLNILHVAALTAVYLFGVWIVGKIQGK